MNKFVLVLLVLVWPIIGNTTSISPIYPESALKQCIEGYVVLSFSVSDLGVVQNVKVVQAKPTGVFEEAAIKNLTKMGDYFLSVHTPNEIVEEKYKFEIEDECEPSGS